MADHDPEKPPIKNLIPLLIDLQHHLDSDVSLQSLAADYGYSPFHFHRLFSGAVGETPKKHVDRLRLERAAYKLAVTGQSVLDIALSVGFKNHETFTRAFKRAFAHSPREYRRLCKAAQDHWSRHNRHSRGDGCLLSDVHFVTLPQTPVLAIRHHGAYADLPDPFQPNDNLWNSLIRAAERNRIPHTPLPLLICYDDPTLTPGPLQRCDACIPIDDPSPVAHDASDDRIRRLLLPATRYGMIEHVGPLPTIDQAYYNSADGIRRSTNYTFDEGPPLQIYRRLRIGGDPAANLTEVGFPVKPTRKREARKVKNAPPLPSTISPPFKCHPLQESSCTPHSAPPPSSPCFSSPPRQPRPRKRPRKKPRP